MAVSGGVDSMVLLDMLVKPGKHQLVVAHFDHGIRPDSQKEAELIAAVCKKHNIPFETKREELGEGASEALARERRYIFLQSVAKKHQARLVTAHHLDDLVETIAINFIRGTGWRGLSVFESEVDRPLIDREKSELILYAKSNGIEWIEDSTNSTDAYLRNRVRLKTTSLPKDVKFQLLALYARQKEIRKELESEVSRLVQDKASYDRYFFAQIPDEAALECLRAITSSRLTRPQLGRLLHAIKTAKNGKRYEAGGGIEVNFTTRQFSL